MNSSSADLFFPTQLEWVKVANCTCPWTGAVCMRPVLFTKPIECVHSDHINDLPSHLLSPTITPSCNNNSSSSNLITPPTCCDPILIIALMFGFCLLQV